ncbi:MAG: GNAT family N-acetyltransferase [Pyrinomonadaceae bacterium]|nr:GNAT family N-acetyltransferase [Pyrinomonadaceae bacterium]
MQAETIVIRPLVESDLNNWFQLRKQLWDHTSDDDHQMEMLDIIQHPDTQAVFVAEEGEGLVGFLEVSVRPFVEDCVTDHVGYLEGWYVAPEARRQGIGSGLVKAAEEWARAHGCIEMASDAEIGNERSITAHSKLGYEETSRLVHLRKEL